MAGPKNLIKACATSAEILRRIGALIAVRATSDSDAIEILPITAAMNNLIGKTAEHEPRESIEGAFEEFLDAAYGKDGTIIAVSTIVTASLILSKLGDSENWADRSSVTKEGTNKFNKKTAELVDELIAEVGRDIKRAEDEE